MGSVCASSSAIVAHALGSSQTLGCVWGVLLTRCRRAAIAPDSGTRECMAWGDARSSVCLGRLG